VPAKKTSESKTPEKAAPVRTRTPKAAVDAVPRRAAKPRAPRQAKAPVAAVSAESTLDAIVVAEVPARRVTAEDIQVRAYFLALEHRGQGGSLDFWLRAERELLTGAGADD
jgi:hypothetical protein